MTLKQLIEKLDGLENTLVIIENTTTRDIRTYNIKFITQKIEDKLKESMVQKIMIVNNTITIYVGSAE